MIWRLFQIFLNFSHLTRSNSRRERDLRINPFYICLCIPMTYYAYLIFCLCLCKAYLSMTIGLQSQTLTCIAKHMHWLIMSQNESEWVRMTQMARNSTPLIWVTMSHNDSWWLMMTQMFRNGFALTWLTMTHNDSQWLILSQILYMECGITAYFLFQLILI